MQSEDRPICHIVAGPNGSGKSTFALRYLPDYAALADSLFVFYAVPMTQRLIYRRNGAETAVDPALAGPMRKELGI